MDGGLGVHIDSGSGQLDLHVAPLGELVDPETLSAGVRYLRTSSDFHRLARQLETRIEPQPR